MNCQEVMDEMQRQLDGDLDERESEALMAHMEHCPECASMFKRLQLISAGLESLPKVTPPYSLVDAILPRLAELSAAEAESGSAAEPGPAVRSLEQRPERIKPARKWMDRFSVRALGGVIAAGVVVGLFLVTYQPGSMDSASDSGMLTSSTQAGSASMESSMDESASEAPKENAEVSASSAYTETEKTEKRIYTSNTPDSGDNKQDAKGEVYERTSEKAAGPEAEPGNAPNEVYTVTSPEKSTSNSAQTGGEAADQPVGQTNVKDQSGVDGDIMMSTAAPAFSEFVSPDDKYRAAVVDNVLNVYSMEDNKLIVSSGDPSPGGFRSIQWSEDGKTLTFEALSEGGKAVKFIIDPEKESITPVQSP